MKDPPNEAISYHICMQAVPARTRLLTQESLCPVPWRDLALSWVSMPRPRTVTMEMGSFGFALLSAAAEARVTPGG